MKVQVERKDNTESEGALISRAWAKDQSFSISKTEQASIPLARVVVGRYLHFQIANLLPSQGKVCSNLF